MPCLLYVYRSMSSHPNNAALLNETSYQVWDAWRCSSERPFPGGRMWSCPSACPWWLGPRVRLGTPEPCRRMRRNLSMVCRKRLQSSGRLPFTEEWHIVIRFFLWILKFDTQKVVSANNIFFILQFRVEKEKKTLLGNKLPATPNVNHCNKQKNTLISKLIT